MNSKQYNKADGEIVYLTVSYSPGAGKWFIESTYPPFITRSRAKTFQAIEGKNIIYMVAGFDNYSDARGFAITYHKAKADGIVHRFRLD